MHMGCCVLIYMTVRWEANKQAPRLQKAKLSQNGEVTAVLSNTVGRAAT